MKISQTWTTRDFRLKDASDGQNNKWKRERGKKNPINKAYLYEILEHWE